MRSLSLDQLRALIVVAKHGSFSEAARLLNLSQPAVSQQIKELEERLGVELLERLGRKSFPTDAGLALITHAERMLAEAEATEEDLRRFRGGALGRVRIGTSTSVLVYLLPRILKEVRRVHPSLEIAVDVRTTRGVVGALVDNELDLGFATLPDAGSTTIPSSLHVIEVRRDPMTAVFAAETEGLPEVADAPYLAARPLVLNAPNTEMYKSVLGWFAAAGVKPKVSLTLGNSEAIKAFVVAGLGAAILPFEREDDPVLEGHAVRRPLCPPLPRVLGIIMRADKRLTPGLRIVRDAIVTMGANV